MKVLVLMGGASSEREVSLRSGKAVLDALLKLGYEAEGLDPKPEALAEIPEKKPDLVYIVLHGKFGEDGTIQGYLDLLGIPYTGSGVACSAICMDKILTKKLLGYEGLPTADFVTFHKNSFDSGSLVVDSLVKKLGLPLVIKAATQGSSIGTYIVKEAFSIPQAIKDAFAYDDQVLVEKFIDGVQLTVTVVGNDKLKVFPVIEITAENEFYDYESKYTPGMSTHIIPARIDENLRQKVQTISEAAYRAAGCRGVSRVDVMIDKQGNPYILEINTIPGMTETSLVPDAARAIGVSFEDLVDEQVKLALEK